MISTRNVFSFYDKNYTYVVVEGSVDEAFIKKLTDKVKVKSIEVWIKEINSFKRQKEYINYKSKVLDELRSNNDVKNLYGMIDTDFNDINEYKDILDKLFITDTHDLETLLLKTYFDLLYEIGDPKVIQENEIFKSYYLAYQIGVIKKSLLRLYAASPKVGNKTNFDDLFDNIIQHYDDICNDDSICLDKLLKHIKLDERIKSFDTIRSYFGINPPSKFNFTREEFVDKVYSAEDSGFWNIVNGHDILNLLCFFNTEIVRSLENKYSDYKYSIFEHALVYEYKANKLINQSDMYEKMKKIPRFLKVQLLS